MMIRLSGYDRAAARAYAWSKRLDMPAYAYKTARGWRWTPDRRIAYMASATVFKIDAGHSPTP